MATEVEGRAGEADASAASARAGEPAASAQRRAWLRGAFIAALVLPFAAAVIGFLGGGPAEGSFVRTPAAALELAAPRVGRNGEPFELRLVAIPSRDAADLTVAIEQPLWRRLRIVGRAETAPQARGAEATLSFGPVAAGQRIAVRLVGHYQAAGFSRESGAATLRDGEQELASLPLTITVFP